MLNEKDLERARSALWSLDAGCPRPEWVRVGMSFKAAGGIFEDWHAWSSTAGNYKGEADCQAAWRSFGEEGPVRAATLFGLAREAGWRDERRDPHQSAQQHRPHQKRQKAAQAPQQPEQGKRPSLDPAALWSRCTPAPPEHGYLARKGMAPDGLRIASPGLRIAGHDCAGWLALPVWSIERGELQSLQLVSPEAGPPKLSLPGCRIAGGALVVHQAAPDGRPSAEAFAGGVAYLAEGVATAASLYQATGRAAVACFGKGNVDTIARALRQQYPGLRLVLCPDRGAEHQAAAIAAGLGGPVAWVELPEDCPPNFDANDYAAAHGLDALACMLRNPKTQPTRFKLAERTAARMFFGEPPPVSWLVQGIFPLGVSALLASPPNVGKSFLALDLAAKVARRRNGDLPSVAFGGIVKAHGRAVYVSAEDDEPEIHRRLWSLCSGDMPDRLHVLSLPDVGAFGIIEPDPMTKEFRPTRAWQDLAEEIRALGDVKLVALDTLQALTSGDTNTVQATQPLMNEAAALARATGACVLLIHHVAKGKSGEIRTALDAMESIRGSGAISGSARCAYVMWPPADGGREVCEVLGEQYQEGKVAFGILAKRYGDARRDRSVFVRDEAGILRDKTQAYNALKGDDTDAMRTELLHVIRAAWAKGEAFAASQGNNGMHARRFELAESFHEKPRAWFEEQAGKLLGEGNIKRMTYKGGARLVPADADCVIPTPPAEDVPGEKPEAE